MAHKMNTSLCTNPTKQSCATMCLLYKIFWQLFTTQNSWTWWSHKHFVTVAVSQNMSLLTHTNPVYFPLKKSIFVFTAIKPVTFLCHWLHLWKWNEKDISNKLNSTSKWVGRKYSFLSIEPQTVNKKGLGKSVHILELD